MSANTDVSVAGGISARRERSLPAAAAGGLLRFMRRKPLGAVGLVIITVLCFAAVFADYIAPYNYDEQKISQRLRDPSREHLLGTDDRGLDMFSRIVYGARVSIFVGLG